MKNKFTLLLGLLVYLNMCTLSFAQEKTVTGVVTDQSSTPLPGVNVLVKNASRGTTTDFDGNYSVSVSLGETLIVSYVGFKTTEVTIGSKDVYNISLETDNAQLDEVVVIGYGTQKRKDVTGAVASIKSESFIDALPVAPEQLLQGKIAGVNIVQSSGQPGAASTVRIRGTSSISAGNDPLYVVDGVPLQFGSANNSIRVATSGSSPLSEEAINPLTLINPADIESIDVLKDASATAIYGSRGANGVIVITTKNKGKFGSFLTYDSYFGVSNVREYLPVLSAEEYRDYATSNNLPFSDQGANTNWQKEVFRTAITQNHNISFAGGSETTNVTGSLGYNNQEGTILNSRLKKYTSRLNANHSAIDNRLKLGVNITYANIDDQRAAVNSNIADEGGNALKDAIRWVPTLPVYNADGSYYQIGPLRINPVSWVDVTDQSETSLFLGNLDASFEIIDGLKLSTNIGHSNENVSRFNQIPSTHPAGEGQGGFASIGKYKNTNILAETNLTFEKQLNANNHISLLAGYSYQRFVTQNTFTSANNFVSDATEWNLIQSGSIQSNTSFKDANRLSSYYGRLNYKLKDRYLLTFTLRRDGSSRFGANNKWGTFPSGALAWNIADEDFMTDSKISNLKLRVGYGITGNQEIPNNLYREQLSIAGSAVYLFGGQAIPSVLPTNFPNPDLKWEETSQLNTGIDFGFFNQRFSGSIDYYVKKTNDLLLQFSTAAPSVVSTQWANVGEVENKGFEVNLNADILNKGDFRWTANLNFSTNKNEVISLSNDNFQRDEIRTASGSGVVGNNAATQIIKPGLPLNTFYGWKFTGYDENGLETYLDEDGEDGADEVVIGDANPDWTFGFNNTFNYKRIDVTLNFRGVVGNDIYNNTAAEFSYVSQAPGINVLKSALTTGASRTQTAQYSSQWLEDGSYLRLDNLTVGYNFNVDKVSFINKAKLYLTGSNLFVITGYSGYDPEVRTRSVGIDYLVYPRPRTFQIGTSISF
ncbi:SusC/RagA family TonB-linked outer membrane protein [Aestuariibaculum sediminum]|uniref:TonB-dependent receptor n=1 Tax=Aestuariibaculum sediminum TaxID=2770637 RepID=A0A8J6Q217_9FLAO|nr:TonB-dependent receptor [Aestuariibaculum sediminum]MBD0831566.1 TonB-dependent receptor [Aestuariibaculum sediminum]